MYGNITLKFYVKQGAGTILCFGDHNKSEGPFWSWTFFALNSLLYF